MVFNTVHSNDFSFFEEVDELVQEEPIEALDPERAGQLAAIGLVNGQPFAPDERMRGILSRAAEIGAGHRPHRLLRAARPGRRALRLVEERVRRRQLRVPAQRRTPARCPHPVPLPRHGDHPRHGARPGRCRIGLRLHGPRQQRRPARRLHAPTGCTSTPTRRRRTSGPSTSTTPRPGPCSRCPRPSGPALASNTGTLQANDDGSYDLYFGPTAPEGKESNWVETIPGKSWFQLFRLYGPLQPWFDQTWKLNEFEPLDT